MILVLSYSSYEQGTEKVIDWLLHKKANFIKVTIEDLYSVDNQQRFHVNIATRKIFHNGKDITSEIRVIFYRRIFNYFELSDEEPFSAQIKNEVTDEAINLIYYLFYLLKDRAWLPASNVANVNKLIITDKAQNAGLKVPKSSIINNKRDLKHFFSLTKHGVITKPINKSSYFINYEKTYFVHVKDISVEDIEALPDFFFPSLFQEKILRDIEIRVFYLDGDFYSMAMINSNETPEVDIKRGFNTDTQHWTVFSLPDIVKEKITKFMKLVSLNTGSMDIILDKDGNYNFIEVNPVGQYGHPSASGNFYLEEKIADWLIKHDIKNAADKRTSVQ
ncbi:hypothetical protein [Emticicia fluvialis]|uniref:hypothetical protein n=1 Tax=Emticicia fluvialis TaxID=2974474 RepID=UPI002165B190|nr:hypothetical protein [Emticicia fluvialis]